MIRKIKRLSAALLLAAGINMPGILSLVRVDGPKTALLLICSAFFFLYANILPPTGNRKGVSADTGRLRQLSKGSALILYAGIACLAGLVCSLVSFREIPEWTAGRVLQYVFSILCWLFGSGILLLNGCLRLMTVSVQMGIRYRLLLFL